MNPVRSIEEINRETSGGRAMLAAVGTGDHSIAARLAAAVASIRRLPNGEHAEPERRGHRETPRCAPGWDRCGTERCHFLPMSHAHCGRCGATCRPDQLCSNGRCI